MTTATIRLCASGGAVLDDGSATPWFPSRWDAIDEAIARGLDWTVTAQSAREPAAASTSPITTEAAAPTAVTT